MRGRGGARRRGLPARPGGRPVWRRCSSARTRPPRSTSRNKVARVRGGRDGVVPRADCRRRRPRPRWRRWSTRLNADDARRRHPRAAAAARRHIDVDARPGADRPRQGRGRLPPAERRAGWSPAAPALRAVHAGRRAWSCCAASATQLDGRASGRGRPLEHRRQAGGALLLAARTPRSRSATRARATSPAVTPPRRHPGRRRRPAADDHGRHGQAGRDGHRRRHQPHRRRAASATSTSTPSAKVAGAITPVPGGVGPMTIAMLLANTLAAASGAQTWAGGYCCRRPEGALSLADPAHAGVVSSGGLHVGRRHREVVQQREGLWLHPAGWR